MAKRKAAVAPTTRKVELSAAIKAARNIMRKDAGLSGEVDRIPQIAWLLFLKAFDDMELRREVTERNYKPTISEPYRWRDWAADPVGGRTGQELLVFINNELLPHLRDLRGAGENDPRDVLTAVFKETFNRMLSGYLLRDVIDVVNRINFASSDDIHTMAHFYESMLREMRDAAGDSGEFYTPRPVIRFIVQQVGLKPNDVILDPAAGTCGFLVEALEHLRPQATSVEQWKRLQRNLRGIEKKPMPYLLGMMNMILHGVEQPNVRRDNALAVPISQLGAAAKVDVVVTNPPFGGEEEKNIQTNFPEATRTSETALLFLQMIQRILKPGGRCGLIVPNGVLFGGGLISLIKQRLVEECNLHTIVRLPPGVFAPYTPIPTNLLFFEKTGPTKDIWFYEHQIPDGLKNYSKTRPLHFDEFDSCRDWWGGEDRKGRKENANAWRVPVRQLGPELDLDLRNPQAAQDYAHLPPAVLLDTLLSTEAEIVKTLEEIRGSLGAST